MPMTGRIALALSLIVLVLGLAACGGDNGSTAATETTTTFDTDTTITTTERTPETTRLRVYFFIDGYVQPVAREVPKTEAVARAAFDAMIAGPTAAESDLGMVNSMESSKASLVLAKNGVLRVSGPRGLTEANLAQIVYTLTQFPTVKQVRIAGKRYTRADFEDWTPAILVESPLAFEKVSNPIHATGTANTFEATFNYEVVDPSGKVVDKNFVTATSGTGTRGTFDFTTKRYAGKAGEGSLVVFEISAKDGSRTKEVRIPVRLQP
jgi:Immunoglobulin-like domain of bacterial spore germination/Sporulation and spore germination